MSLRKKSSTYRQVLTCLFSSTKRVFGLSIISEVLVVFFPFSHIIAEAGLDLYKK